MFVRTVASASRTSGFESYLHRELHRYVRFIRLLSNDKSHENIFGCVLANVYICNIFIVT